MEKVKLISCSSFLIVLEFILLLKNNSNTFELTNKTTSIGSSYMKFDYIIKQ